MRNRKHPDNWLREEETDLPRWTERGPYAGRGPRGYRRSDERIEEDINERLTQHPDLDATDIEVTVEHAEVTLNGTVADRAAKRLAEAIADSVWGIVDIHNRLRLAESGGTHPIADPGLFSGNRSITVDALNELLHEELAAVKSYRLVLEQFPEEAEAHDFRDLETAHLQAADALHEHVIERGGAPTDQMPAPWLDVGASSRVETVLGELQKGEAELKRLYERALFDRPGVERACQRLIEDQLLPDTRGHGEMLTHLAEERRRKAGL